jgi:hypothetical protein
MAVSTFRLIAVALFIGVASSAGAVTVTAVKVVNLTHDQTSSPFFTSSPSGVALGAANNTQGANGQTIILKPQGTVQANTVSSLVSTGQFTIVGSSTSAGNWVDGNGLPAGITLKFNTAFTVSVDANSPVGSTLTTAGVSGTNLGNGLGITQTTWNGTSGGTSTIDSSNLNEVPGSGTDVLDISAVTVTGINFTGTMTEAGFNFAPGSVGNFGPYVLRSNGFTEAGETLALFSANNPDPLGQGRPAIGFGTPSSDPSEVGRGEGFVASHLAIDNGFVAGLFPRQIGAFTLVPQNGTMALKGLGFEYDVTYGITPIVAGDYNKNGVVDAADYALWRKGDLAADSNGDTVVDQTDYDFWRARFGNGGPGAGAGLSGASVPEPAALTLLAIGLLATCSGRRGKLLRTRTI